MKKIIFFVNCLQGFFKVHFSFQIVCTKDDIISIPDKFSVLSLLFGGEMHSPQQPMLTVTSALSLSLIYLQIHSHSHTSTTNNFTENQHKHPAREIADEV